jgi:hypothetical protein
MSHTFQVTFDANDPQLLAEFWCRALGYMIQPPPPGFDSWDEWARVEGIPEENWNDARAIVDPGDDGPRIFFQKVPERKTAKNRVHLDVDAGGGSGGDREDRIRAVETHAEQLIAAGASFYKRFDQPNEYWIVLKDPEGNEFCVQ